MRKYLITSIFSFTAALLLLLATPQALAGRIDPELAAQLQSAAPGQLHAVIVRLTDQVDHDALRASVQHERKPERVRKTVQALRDKAALSQADISGHLAKREQEGKVKGVKSFWIFNGFALKATAAAIEELAARPDVAEIVPDRVITLAAPIPAAPASGSWNLDMIGAPTLWQMGFTGQNVVVANLDTGVDINHAALYSGWRGWSNGGNSWFEAYTSSHNYSSIPYDTIGHGTGTMGVMVAGNDQNGVPIGVAPGAKWIAAKIFFPDPNISINPPQISKTSWIHDAFQWMLSPWPFPGPQALGNTADAPDVVNCSWGGDPGVYDLTFETDIQALKTARIAVVFAAGNSGPTSDSSVSPANNPGAFAVGATGSKDFVSAFSSRGPSAAPVKPLYPDVVAPGEGVRTTDLTLSGVFPNSYTTESGTSFAAPHVAGAMALLLSINPALTVDQLEDAFRSGALLRWTNAPDNNYGNGRLDILQAVRNLDKLGLPLNNVTVVPPSGDVNDVGSVNVADALIVLRAAVGLQPWTAGLMYNGDVGPLVAGVPAPDRKLNVLDALLILRKAVGRISW